MGDLMCVLPCLNIDRFSFSYYHFLMESPAAFDLPVDLHGFLLWE